MTSVAPARGAQARPRGAPGGREAGQWGTSSTGIKPLLRLLGYLGNYRSTVAWTIFCLIGTSLLGLVTPWLIQQVIDRTLQYRSLSVLGLYALGVIAIAFVNAGLNFGQRYLMAYTIEGAIYDLRNELYRYIIHLPFGYHDRARTGQLISRLTSDIDHVSRFFSFGLSTIVSMMLTFLGACVMLFRMSWQLGLLGLMLVPPMAITAVRGSHSLGPQFYALRQQFGRITAQLQENFAGVRVVKAFAREAFEVAKFRKELAEFLRRNMAVIRIFSIFMPIMSLLTELGTLLILAYGGFAVINGRLSVGELVAAQAYLMMLTGPVQMLGWMVVMARQAIAAGDRIYDVLDARPEIAESPQAIELPPVRGEIRLENVSFGYEEGSMILKEINLTIRPGEKVAFLGATGSGKTTVVNLIPRFYDATAGRVLIDGYDVRDVTLSSLRQQIATIFQEAVLFTGTIAENIAFGRAGASREQVISAAQAAQAHEFITRFAQGYETHVGERGVTVSGGQRQRLTIARALLMDAPILIMDDSTSSVDVETEYLIQQALNEAMRGRTSLIIAHRLSTVKNADRIIVLDAGRIAEEGTHEELLARGGLYRRIYETQFADQEETA